MRAAGKKSRAVDYVGTAFHEWFEQHGVVCRIVLKVGILDDDKIPRSLPDTAMQSCTFAHILGLQ